jgi:stage V sporulation protein B
VELVGAAISTVICHMIAVIIEFQVLKKQSNLKLSYKKFFVKPAIAVVGMGVVSYFLYWYSIPKIGEKLALIVTLGAATIIYSALLIILKVFSKEEIAMIPYGKKLYETIEFRKK